MSRHFSLFRQHCAVFVANGMPTQQPKGQKIVYGPNGADDSKGEQQQVCILPIHNQENGLQLGKINKRLV
jgi:hypothetical protein